ncbi:hypothetical protein [Streptomyces cucumeris]|uniref:hypothetical protein n=1 Tax=Streptomyces cucumeris TaxID=2962890 RepID=UPI003D75A18E
MPDQLEKREDASASPASGLSTDGAADDGIKEWDEVIPLAPGMKLPTPTARAAPPRPATTSPEHTGDPARAAWRVIRQE